MRPACVSRCGQPYGAVFFRGESSGASPDNRQNIRRRLFIERANKGLAEFGIEPIGKVAPQGLRRTFAALRCVARDDPTYTAARPPADRPRGGGLRAALRPPTDAHLVPAGNQQGVSTPV
jgi:hypothetical protein